MGAKIRLATNEADRNAVFRFRYEIYVKGMKRVQKYADHENCMIQEPLDNTGHLLIAEDSGRTVGTARFNVGVDGNFGLYDNLYRLKEFDSFYPSSVSITTKLMVSPEFRHSPLPLQLVVRCYVVALRLGDETHVAQVAIALLEDGAVVDCNEHLVPFFKKLGYRQVFPDIIHPEYGHVVPMVLAVLDRQHLEHVGSLFARHARKTTDPRDSVSFFREKFLSKRDEVPQSSFQVFAENNSGANHDSLIG